MDRLANKAFFVLFPLVVGISIYTGWANYNLSKDLRGSINNNQSQQVQARKDAIARDNRNKAYIKCVVLSGKKYPDVNFQTLNYDQTEPYLDDCATSTNGLDK